MPYTLDEHEKIMDEIVRGSHSITHAARGSEGSDELEKAKARIARLEYVLTLIAGSWGPTRKWPAESRCTVAIYYEDLARAEIDPEWVEQRKKQMEEIAPRLVQKWMRGFGWPW